MWTRKNAAFVLVIAAAIFARPGSASQTSPPTPATNPVAGAPLIVVLDPAHGGADAGAHSSSGINESDVVLNFARQIRTALQVQGVSVLMTRDANIDPSFDDRSAIVNALPHAIFVSLHVSSTGIPGTVRVYSLPNFATAPPAPPTAPASALLPPPVEAPNPHPGLRSWDTAQDSFLDLSRRLAALLQTQLAQRFRGSPQAPAAVAVRQLRTIAAPAVAVEVSSVSVPDRSQLDAMSGPLANAVARAVLDFAPLYAINAAPAAPAEAN